MCPRPKIYGLSRSNQIKVDHTVHSAFVCDFHNRNWATLNKEHEQVALIQIHEYVCLSSSLWGTSLQMLLLFPRKGFTEGPGAFMNLWWLLHYRSGIVRLRWDHPPTQPFTPTEFCWTSRPPDNPLFFNVSLLWCWWAIFGPLLLGARGEAMSRKLWQNFRIKSFAFQTALFGNHHRTSVGDFRQTVELESTRTKYVPCAHTYLVY